MSDPGDQLVHPPPPVPMDSETLDMFDAHHDGVTYEPELDKVRLNAQMLRTYEALRDGMWFTLRRLSDPEASVSARLRDLRKVKFGGHEVERRRVDGGLFEYRLNDAWR